MKNIDFYLDFISPYAYLAFHEFPQAMMGLSYRVTYKPVLLGAILNHHGQLGPAEIEAKRSWTYRQVGWLAQKHQLVLQMPCAHPFNPLQLLRLATGTSSRGEPNRFVCETLFKHVWNGGADPLDEDRLSALKEVLVNFKSVGEDDAKELLKKSTDEAISKGVFGVPAFIVDDKLFWGFDSLPMLRSYLEDDAWFAGPEWMAASQVPVGVNRRR